MGLTKGKLRYVGATRLSEQAWGDLTEILENPPQATPDLKRLLNGRKTKTDKKLK